ncbi:MAG TPA: hypothetical protein VK003_13665, partial [Oceanobacillus sp.]|nr:hypothetical protein [Oceanobacillus sp.]
LILNLNTHVLGGAKLDNFEYLWKMWWVPHAIFERGISPFFHPDIYVPFGYPLAYGEITPVHTFGMIPFTLLFGEIISYNLSALASFILTGWAMYALARRWLARLTPSSPARVKGEPNEESVWSDSRLLFLAAFFAGAALAFCAYRMQKLTGHVPMSDTQWLVLTLLFFDWWLERRELRDAAFTGLFFSLSALSSWYYPFMLILLLPVYALFRVESIRQLLTDRRSYIALGVAAIITAVLCVPFLIPYLQLNTEGATYVPLEEAAFWSASPTDYVMPNPLHPLWGNTVQKVMWPFPSPMMTEFVISIGWITIVLTLFAWRETKGKNWRALKALVVTAFILSLGPILYLSRLPLNVPMPAYIVREIMPFADSLRSWGRFSIFVMLGCSLLAGAGLILGLGTLTPRIRYSGAVIALVLVLFAAWIGPFPQTRVEPRPVDLWLAEQPDNAPIMEYPIPEALSGPAMLYTRYHQKPVVFGYGTYLPLLYRQRHPDLYTFPDDAALDQLEQWGVHYVLITVPALSYDQSFTMDEVDTQPRLRHVTSLGDVVVYELLPDPEN